MYLKRIAETALATHLSSGKISLVLGARQVGKTTLVEQVLQGKPAVFLNFDLDLDQSKFLAAATQSPSEGLRMLGSPEVLVLDEAQRLPEAARITKGWHDVRLPVRMVLLGSSSLTLLDQAAESLTGRNRKLTLPPLVFSEALQSQEWHDARWEDPEIRRRFAGALRAFLMQRLAFGSYPEVVLSHEPAKLLRELSADYLWKDILQTGLVKSPDLIRRLLTLLAHQVGSEVSIHELATQLQMARPTVERYLDLLEQTFVTFRLPAFSSNPRKEIAKSRKIYFWDTGIRNALLGAFDTNERRPDIGALWENWVIAEFAKQNALHGFPAQLYFWRSRTQAEVDLVIQDGARLLAFEAKWQPRRRAAGAAFRDAYRTEVVTLGPENPWFGSTEFRAAPLASD